MSEEYGGVIAAVTGGNPLYEIMLTLLYQLVTYAMFQRGTETAKANEEMTIEDIKKRFPKLIEAAGKEYANDHNLLAQKQAQQMYHPPQNYGYNPQQPNYYQAPPPPAYGNVAGNPLQKNMTNATFAPPSQMQAPSIDMNSYMQTAPTVPEVSPPPNAQYTHNPQIDETGVPIPQPSGAMNALNYYVDPIPPESNGILTEQEKVMMRRQLSAPNLSEMGGPEYTGVPQLPQTISTRSGKPLKIMVPTMATQVPLPEDNDDELDDGELVIDIDMDDL
jgi:hypothetical protein